MKPFTFINGPMRGAVMYDLVGSKMYVPVQGTRELVYIINNEGLCYLSKMSLRDYDSFVSKEKLLGY